MKRLAILALILLASCATTATPASAGGVTINLDHGSTVVMIGDVRKEGANSAPNSSKNSPSNTPDIKPVLTPAP
jgi:hypothetical protein